MIAWSWECTPALRWLAPSSFIRGGSGCVHDFCDELGLLCQVTGENRGSSRRGLRANRLLRFAANHGFSTDFHTRIIPLTPSPTPFYPATSAPIIRTRRRHSNDDAVHRNLVLINSNYRAIMCHESKALPPSDDPLVSAPPVRPPSLNVTPLRSPPFPPQFHSSNLESLRSENTSPQPRSACCRR